MPIVRRWLIPGRVILSKPQDDIMLEDHIEQRQALNAMFSTGQPPVHLIFDIREMGRVRVPLAAVIRYASYLRHPNFGWAVLYGQSYNRLARLMTDTVGQRFGVKYRMFDFQERAIAFLAQQDASLSASVLLEALSLVEEGPPVWP
ncbi:MAG: hypothetical protein HC915_15160 [Anaerolineae bacterium]|nr:hypothetical protein [Anaerolineae bacterium]